MSQMVNNSLAIQETWVWSLDQEDALENGMATHSSILAWRITWTEESGRVQFMGLQRVRCGWATNTFFTFFLSINAWLWNRCLQTVARYLLKLITWNSMISWRFWKNINTYKANSGSVTRQDYLLLELYFRIMIIGKY